MKQKQRLVLWGLLFLACLSGCQSLTGGLSRANQRRGLPQQEEAAADKLAD